MSDPAFRKTVLYETPAEDARNPLRLCICRFALIEGGGYRIIRHRHPEYEFMIPLDGPYESVLNGKRLLVHPGQQILIQPGDIHEDLCDGAFRFAAFRFRFEGADGIARPVPVLRRELSPEERIVPNDVYPDYCKLSPALKKRLDNRENIQDDLFLYGPDALR